MEERLQKILSRYGVASRRQAEELIRAGRVRLNGNTAVLGDTAVDGEDQIQVDGVFLRKEPKRLYIMLNKPRGFVTTMKDEKDRRTVWELVCDCGQRVYPVGRLDMFSEGLLLLTNDGAFANNMTHPSHEVEKVYTVWVSGFYDGADAALKTPIDLDGRRISPPGVKLLHRKDDIAALEVTIHEGRNRQVRRMCQTAGLTVTRLKRVREGALSLGDLPVGTWRHLTEEEVESLQIGGESRV